MITALSQALVQLAAEGRRPPCGDPEAKPLFTSDNPEEREAAAHRCRHCPISRECLREALETRATAGVWGGIDFDKRMTPATRRQMLAQLDTPADPGPTLFEEGDGR